MIESALSTFAQQLVSVLRYPFSPDQRFFIPYLLSSFLFAAGAYLYSPNFKRDRHEKRNVIKGLFIFVFPREVWQHPSTWVDVKYFIPHQMLRLWIYTDFLYIFVVLGGNGTLGALHALSGRDALSTIPADNIWLMLAFSAVSLIAIDFISFFIHLLQHKIPVLWEFHKIHHSSEVLNPLSNYREHPVDNLTYAIASGLATGTAMGLFMFLSGSQPLGIMVPMLGITVYAFLYNLIGYNLRHSHIWVRWPGIWGYVFGCPAHHQIHHSCKPEHIDKNFAFMLPIWDVLFGTFVLPKEKIDLVLGIGDGTEREYKGYFSNYVRPFVVLSKKLIGSSKSE